MENKGKNEEKRDFSYVPEEMWRELAIDFAKRWLSHDGLWFQSVERNFGLEAAIENDIAAWKGQTQLEAKRIMKLLHISPGGGLDALEEALRYRMYAFINEQKTIRRDENTLDYYMTSCRVQRARQGKNMDFFPCKPVGQVEYEYFAKTIDHRIVTTCIGCPPDEKHPDWYCGWRFTL